jgi:transmembrane sensor
VSTPDQPSPSEDSAAAEHEAAEFLQRRRFWSWSDADQAELEAWLGESVSHRVAYLRLQAGTTRIERLVALRPPKPGEDNARADGAGAHERGRLSRWVLPLVAFAASLILAFVLGIPLVANLTKPADRAFATEVGGRAVLRFADGTEFELNTDSALRYRMTSRDRIVWLDRGEAYFRVTHDAAHPFMVFAGGRRITDLGTEFLVRNDTGAFEVALVKGRAQLSSGARAATLTPGDEAVATSVSVTVTRKTPQELADELAWRRGVLVFRNTRLADAVRGFNRYSSVKLVIADPAIADLRIGGEFKTSDIADFLALAEAVLKVRSERTADEILLSREPGEGERAAKHKRSH